MLERVISGGQTGADQAAWRAARRAGIPTGGWMPPGFQTEDGPRPEFARQFRAEEHPSDRVPDLRTTPDNARVENAARTISNVLAADGTLIFASDPPGPGTRLTALLCEQAGSPRLAVPIGRPEGTTAVEEVAAWVRTHRIRTLNVAGERESHAPGIGAWVEAYLDELFRLLGPEGLRA